MSLLFSSIPKELVMEHYILPCDCFIEFEFNLVYFMAWLHMDEKVGVIENRIYKEIGTIFNIIYSSCWRFNEKILSDPSFSFFKKNPAVNSFS